VSADQAAGRFNVFLATVDENETCSGSFTDPSRIVTAGHCFPGQDASVELVVRRGVDASDCVGACAPITFAVTKGSGDIEVLRASSPLVPDIEDMPLLLAGGPAVQTFKAYGYGVGSYRVASGVVSANDGEHLIEANFNVLSEDDAFINAEVTPSSGSPCDGDSGGPAIIDLNGAPAILGVLHDSDGTGICTPVGGTATWSRLEPPLFPDCESKRFGTMDVLDCGTTAPDCAP
jgi:hypothetical protein